MSDSIRITLVKGSVWLSPGFYASVRERCSDLRHGKYSIATVQSDLRSRGYCYSKTKLSV